MNATATLAGGCFWCTEAVFERVRGVLKVTSGYAGGDPKRADYEHVSMGNTGHAEAIQIDYDPQVVSYDSLLDIFFATHDATTLNQQQYDIGTMYRSIIFYHSDEQREIAQTKIKPEYVTELIPYTGFFPAEGYHQNFYEKNSSASQYCAVIIDPKIKKLFAKFADQIKPEYSAPVPSV